MSSRIYISLSTFAQNGSAPMDALKQSGMDFTVNATGERLKKAQVIEFLKGYDGVVAGLEPYDNDALKQLPQLKCISRCGVGIDNVDLPFAAQRGVTVLNTPEVVVQPVAELTVGMIFDLLRKITFHTELLRHNRWERLTGLQLAGKSIGIIGLGRIGKRVAQLLRGLGVTVMAFDLFPDEAFAKEFQIQLLPLEKLLASSDIICLHVAINSANPFVLKEVHLRMMKPGGFVVNVSRGSAVDEGALVKVLTEGYLAGAALDVFQQEPYQGPLSQMNNVILTPHVGTLTVESRLEMEGQAVTNIIDFFKSSGKH